jgi:hypothetical protein
LIAAAEMTSKLSEFNWLRFELTIVGW